MGFKIKILWLFLILFSNRNEQTVNADVVFTHQQPFLWFLTTNVDIVTFNGETEMSFTKITFWNVCCQNSLESDGTREVWINTGFLFSTAPFSFFLILCLRRCVCCNTSLLHRESPNLRALLFVAPKGSDGHPSPSPSSLLALCRPAAKRWVHLSVLSNLHQSWLQKESERSGNLKYSIRRRSSTLMSVTGQPLLRIETRSNRAKTTTRASVCRHRQDLPGAAHRGRLPWSWKGTSHNQWVLPN